ncbi:MAG: GNAT family N-acetyltransferase [Terricaulis sp.]
MIETRRLRLIPATPEMLHAELAGDMKQFASLLVVAPPRDWPPELYDADAMRFALNQMERDGPHSVWGFHYFVLKRALGQAILIGAGGYKGAPRDGAVELGYSVLASHRRKGFASEAVRAMVKRAFADPAVSRVIAHTLTELIASQGVLTKCGFELQHDTLEQGAIMYALKHPFARRR